MSLISRIRPEAALSEFVDPALGDRRLTERLHSLVGDIARSPAKSLPNIFSSSAKLEAAYRFFGNESVTPGALLAPHIAETLKRVAECMEVRIVHDTSKFRFNGDRKNLGILTRDARGFFAHYALAVGPTELREPLGVVGTRTYVNDDDAVRARRKRTRTANDSAWKKVPRQEKARYRWESLACEVAAAVPAGVRAVHVMDQEADDFHVFLALLKVGAPFVIRGAPTRLTLEGPALGDVLKSQPHRAFRTIRITRRLKTRARHPRRDERDAELRIRFAPVSIRRPNNVKEVIDTEHLQLYVVHVFEPSPPEGEEAVEWVLFTSEPVTNLDEALAVVDHYRARWIIEEFFKALKTGCSMEQRQLTTYAALVRLLSVFVPIAWQLLRIRYLARQPAPPPAAHVFDATQLEVMKALLRDQGCDYELPDDPTTRDVLLGIAALGGHIPNNGEPGWQVIARGYHDFRVAERAWRGARWRCDQS
jgi:hypothetical protein